MSTNQAVTDFLNYYIDLEAPEYAVMLKGEWGSGKTWFIKNFLRHKYKTDSDKNLYLYQSLYGIGSITELENCIFGQLNPFWTSKIGKIGTRVLGLVAKNAALSQGVTGEVKTDDLIDKLKKMSGRVIIFDDLERSHIPLKELLGYINQFVEHDGYRVILLANEESIEGEDYTTTKEKLVGRTFGIQTDVLAALSSFSEGIKTDVVKTTFEKNAPLIVKIYQQSGYNNLRILKHSLHDFERICKGVSEEAQGCEALMAEFLQSFLCLSFEIRTGSIQASEIRDLMKVKILTDEFSYQQKPPEPQEQKKYSDLATKYQGGISYYGALVTYELWEEIFTTGFAPTVKLNERFANSKYFINCNRPDWVKLWHNTELTDSEFDVISKAVHKDWLQKNFEDWEVVLHVAGILLRDCNLHQPRLSKKKILTEAKSLIAALKNKSLLSPTDPNNHSHYFDRRRALGLGFCSNETDEFKELWGNLKSQRESVALDSYAKIAAELTLALSDKNHEAFADRIKYEKEPHSIALTQIPIFNFVDKKAFFNAFLKASPKTQNSVIVVLSVRMDRINAYSALASEISWFLDFNAKLTSEISKRKNLNSGATFRSLQEHYLEPNIKKLNLITDEISKRISTTV